MVDVATALAQGFDIALRPLNLAYALVGAFLGTVVGVLPGIGPAGALALTLPIVLTLDPSGAIIMLATLYTGAMYGGSTTSILLNVPGESSSVVTCLDGHQMALQGRAGPALCIAAIGSFIAGTLGVVALMLFAPFIATAAIDFGPPEYFALTLFGLSAVASLAGASLLKGLLAMVFGLMLATVGTDITGVARYTMGLEDLLDGVEFLAVSIGLFAVSEVLISAREIRKGALPQVLAHRVFIRWGEVVESMGAILRGAIIGFLVGVLPGAGAGIASFLAYSAEVQVSRRPERFGTGEIRGVAAPESANNAASAGALVPMLTLGVPGSGTTAVVLVALLALDIHPGPLLFTSRPDVVWGLIAALYIGNVMLLILNLPLVGLFVRLLYIPMRILLPTIIVISVVGVYSANQSTLDVLLLFGFGVLGYQMRSHDYPVAPVILGIVLGPRMEEALRQSMVMVQGDALALAGRPIVAFFLVLALLSMLTPVLLRYRRVAGVIEQEGA